MKGKPAVAVGDSIFTVTPHVVAAIPVTTSRLLKDIWQLNTQRKDSICEPKSMAFKREIYKIIKRNAPHLLVTGRDNCPEGIC